MKSQWLLTVLLALPALAMAKEPLPFDPLCMVKVTGSVVRPNERLRLEMDDSLWNVAERCGGVRVSDRVHITRKSSNWDFVIYYYDWMDLTEGERNEQMQAIKIKPGDMIYCPEIVC